MHELDGDEKFAFIVYTIIAGVCVITACVLLYITVKVIRKVGETPLCGRKRSDNAANVGHATVLCLK